MPHSRGRGDMERVRTANASDVQSGLPGISGLVRCLSCGSMFLEESLQTHQRTCKGNANARHPSKDPSPVC